MEDDFLPYGQRGGRRGGNQEIPRHYGGAMNAVMTAAHDGGEETVNLTEETEEETYENGEN